MVAEKERVMEKASCYAKLSLRQRLLIDKTIAERLSHSYYPERNCDELREALAAHIDFLEDVARQYGRISESTQETLH